MPIRFVDKMKKANPKLGPRASSTARKALQGQRRRSVRSPKSRSSLTCQSNCSPPPRRNSGNAIHRGIRRGIGKSGLLRNGLQSAWIRSRQVLVGSLLEKRTISQARFQANTGTMVLELVLDNGRQIIIEPVLTNMGCSGLLVMSPNSMVPEQLAGNARSEESVCQQTG